MGQMHSSPRVRIDNRIIPVKLRERCGAIYEPTGQVCTKKNGHYPKTMHSNEKPSHEVAWNEDGTTIRNPH